MNTSVLPVSNFINVSLQALPSGLQESNVNVVSLFTTETPSNSDMFRQYITAQQVVDDYGTGSVTAQMANNVFAQTPNLRTGNGTLVIVPMQSAVSATSGNFETADISANLSDFLLVTDGDLRVTVDGANVDLTGLNFTSATTYAQVAEILQRSLQDVLVTATETAITFTSKKVGASSVITIASVPTGSGTDLSGAGYLNESTGNSTLGVNASGETLVDAIDRVQDSVFFAGVMTNLEMEDAVVTATATAIQAQNRLFVHHFSSVADLDGVIDTIQQATQTKTRALLYTNSKESANLYKSAYVGRAFSVNFSGVNTASTMNLKPLANVLPDSGLTQTSYLNAESKGADTYASFNGVVAVTSTGGNDYFDNVYSDIQLQFSLEASIFNFLRQTNTKISQTETGMIGLKNSVAQVGERFVTNGYIGTGLTWNSSDTFGNPEIFRNNITEKGYYTYSLPIAQQDQTERESRKAPLMQFAFKRDGAIHSSDVIVNIED